jgi:hypothetical protein
MPTKNEKLNRIPDGAISQQPLPEWPKLPESFYKRHPEDRAELDAYQQKCIDFFKKSSNRAS